MKQTQNRTRQFSLIIIFQLLLGIYCNLNSNSVSMQWNLDKWNKTNYCECSSCEYLIKNKTEPSIIKFNVRRKNISFLLQYNFLILSSGFKLYFTCRFLGVWKTGKQHVWVCITIGYEGTVFLSNIFE